MKASFLQKIGIFSLAFIFFVSCGSRKLQSNPLNPQGDGNQTVNTLVVTPPPFDFSNNYEGVSSQSISIPFQPSAGAVTNFTVDLDDESKQNGDWAINKSTGCAAA